MPKTFPLNTAQVQMTLAALAYASDTKDNTGNYPPMSVVKARITGQLDSNDFKADNTWSVVWGPVETGHTDNLLFVARNSEDGALSVCLRGTTTQFFSRVEDIPTSQTAFPDNNSVGAQVSTEFYKALDLMLTAKDPDKGITLQEYLAPYANANQMIYVNGHSQGAALVPMMMLALRSGWKDAPALPATYQGFAFAPPTSGNPQFADLVSDTLDCWFVINPLDIVPLGYDSIKDVIKKDIPGPMPDGLDGIALRALVNFAAHLAAHAGTWGQPAQQIRTSKVPLPDLHFFEQIGGQHSHNSYLFLLGAPQILNDATGPSPMSGTITPPTTLNA
jgi:hypothetical protein